MMADPVPDTSSEVDTQAVLRRIFGVEYTPPQPPPKTIETEADWLTATKLDALLTFLQPRVTRRKPLLLGVAGCRRIWHLVSDVRLQKLIEVAEQFADEEATKKDLRRAAKAVSDPHGGEWNGACYSAVTALADFVDAHPMGPANIVTKYAPLALCKQDESILSDGSRAIIEAEKSALAALTRDIFGNPFRPAAVDPSWLTSDVVALAEGIYQDKAFDRMPILADALQDAGCDNDDVLNHCRSEGPHVRGCWVVDLLTGRT